MFDMNLNDRFRFQKFFDYRPETDECLNWEGSLFSNGYGAFWLKGKSVLAHRIAYFLAYGDFNEELDVLHKCDNRACVNPKHLFLGTDQDNMDDMIDKGRKVILSGENHGSSVLTDAECQEIRTKYNTGAYTQQKLAAIYCVSQQQISNVVNGRQRR